VKEAVTDAEVALAGSGRVLLRKSGTEPVIRVMSEAATEEACQSAVDAICAVIRANGLCK
jgi:phosphoglucosamine mutase